MFKTFLNGSCEQALPFSEGRYVVNLSDLSVSDNGIVLPTAHENKIPTVRLDWVFGEKYYPLSLLIAHAFKPTLLPINYWGALTVGHADGDQTNLDPENLVWLLAKETGAIENNGFSFVPMASSYLINKDGSVFSKKRKKFLKPSRNSGYFLYVLIGDMGERITVARHRLMAMVFLGYTQEVDRLQINHKNGIKGDDFLGNFEWVTCKENINHAFDNGLRYLEKPVFVENTVDHSTRIFKSLKLCCEHLGLHRKTVGRYLTKDPWTFEKWPFKLTYLNEEDRLESSQRSTKVLVRDMRTGIVLEYESIVDCADALDIPKFSLQTRLDSEYDRVYSDGLQIRRKRDNPVWYEPENVEESIATAEYTKTCLLKYCATSEVVLFESQRELAAHLGLSEPTVHMWLKTQGRKIFKDRDGKYVQVCRAGSNVVWNTPDNYETVHEQASLKKRVIVRNIRTGEESEYDSGAECAKALGILTTTLNNRLASKGQRLFKREFQFKYKTETLPFKKFNYVPPSRNRRRSLL